MNVLAGSVQRSAGDFRLGGHPIGRRVTFEAQRNGLRCVFQELSFCAPLPLVENARILHRGLNRFGWRKTALDLTQRSTQSFPGTASIRTTVADLAISERQMAEIAQHSANWRTRQLRHPRRTDVSAGSRGTGQLLEYIRNAAAAGIAIILITHRLNEILAVCDRVVVMVDGLVAAEHPAAGLTRERSSSNRWGRSSRACDWPPGRIAAETPLVVNDRGKDTDDLTVLARRGEIVGFAGLDGHGQRDRLRSIFDPREPGKPAPRRSRSSPGTGRTRAFSALVDCRKPHHPQP